MTAAKGSFEKQTSDLCHNSPSGLTQIGAALCQLTQIGLTSQQSGAELCHLQGTHHHSSSRQSQLTNANDTDRVTQIAGPICVTPFCSATTRLATSAKSSVWRPHLLYLPFPWRSSNLSQRQDSDTTSIKNSRSKLVPQNVMSSWRKTYGRNHKSAPNMVRTKNWRIEMR